ncbi:MAG: murein biosynthesis integral membrane protein MurJ [Blastocatellia bacterium]|nr:MAG: murein biosynthesis integral membrane protein MurJ [Blastocatellia bacterium]
MAGIATLASRILGLVRDQVLAAFFGASNDMDAFIVAFRIPNLVRDLFAEGAMSAAFVPTFTKQLTLHGKNEAWRLGNNVLNALLLVTGGLVALGVVFAHPIVTAYAANYAAVPGKLELTVHLTRVMLPFLVTVAVAAAMMGMLNSLHHYFLPALAPATFNVATIVGAFSLMPLMPWLGWPPIMAIAVSAIVGGIGQILIQWPALRHEGFRYRALFEPRDPGLRQVLLLMGPGTIGLAATQVNAFVNTLLATGQGTGAASWLSYAFRLMYLPIGLFGVSIATAALPVVSRHAATDDVDRIRDTVSHGISLMLMLNVPATLGLMTLATPIVRLLFERGRFLPADTEATAAALRLYAVGLIGYSTARIASPTFYALRQSRIPVAVSISTIALNIVLSVILVRAIGFRGLALGTALAALADGALLLFLLRRRLNGIDAPRLTIAFVKVMIASLTMAAAVGLVQRAAVDFMPDTGFAVQSTRLAIEIAAGLAALAVAARLLKISEFADAVDLVRSRFVGNRRTSV